MGKLVKKVDLISTNWISRQLYMYGEASVEANQEMQEPLERLYQYENQPDMREKIREYIGELDLKGQEFYKRANNCHNIDVTQLYTIIATVLDEVKNDLKARLNEVI